MSMLAGPKRKKQYVLNPRGKALYNDEDRFGSKMLQKMGWTKGKGLGAKESGSVDFVRVNFKCDAAGLGFEDRDDQWTQHEKGFNGFLETLNAETSSSNNSTNGNNNEDSGDKSTDEDNLGRVGFGFTQNETKTKSTAKAKKLTENISGHSLEERSKQSRARVHYKKYTRGKDLSRYSEKDLANIFGKKVGDNNEIVEKSSSASSEENEEDEIKNETTEESVMLKKSTTSIDEYFKNKMLQKNAAKLGNKNKTDENEPSTVVAESKMKKRKSKEKFKQVQAENADHIDEPNQTDSTEPKKKKKKKKQNEPEEAEGEHHEIVSAITEPNESVVRESKKKKKKKTHSDEVLDAVSQKDQLEHQTANNNKSALNSINSQIDCMKVKTQKKKRKSSIDALIASNAEDDLYMTAAAEEKSMESRSNKNAVPDNEIPLSIGAAAVQTMESVVTKTTTQQKKLKNPNEPLKIEKTENSIKLATTSQSSQIVTNVKNKSNLEGNVKFLEAKTVNDAKTISNMDEFHKFYCTYQISTFVAEKFRHLDFNKFRNSNLAQIIGYSHDENLKIEITQNLTDEFRILDLWKRSFDKYSDRKLIREQMKQTKHSQTIPANTNTTTTEIKGAVEKTTTATKTKVITKSNNNKRKGKKGLNNLKRQKRRNIFKLGI